MGSPETARNIAKFRKNIKFLILNLLFENDVMETEAIWMIGIYVQLVWDYVICKKKTFKIRNNEK